MLARAVAAIVIEQIGKGRRIPTRQVQIEQNEHLLYLDTSNAAKRFEVDSSVTGKRLKGLHMATKNKYQKLILEVFKRHYSKGIGEFEFERGEIEDVAKELDVSLPKNLGDLIYSFRYRAELPHEITKLAPSGMEWRIEPAGRAVYRFKLGKINRIIPRDDLLATKIPNATPEIISAVALNDEQALLAKVRYNRLIDVFLGLTAYSLQNHMRTTVKSLKGTQIEIDELYVGVNRNGAQFIIPVQAKGGNDQLATI